MMTLPDNPKNDVKTLNQIFNYTVATYKFYWFHSMLNIVVREQRSIMTIREIIIGMIAEAWYPVHFFRLSFGKSDSLYDQIILLHKELNIPVDANKNEIKRQILNNFNIPEIKRILHVFTLNVPYRFLSPWITYTNDKEVIELSKSFTNNCLYSISKDTIEINPVWMQYLNDNYLILNDFTFWNLTIFIQKRNPNVPNISSKLIKPILRESLTKQRNFWDSYIEMNGSIKCIYTGNELFRKKYALDHFIPWSYVSHNLMWNLLPAEKVANNSKSNNLPVLEEYLSQFSQIHQQAIKTIYQKNPSSKLLEDYLTLYHSIPELINLTENDFQNVFRKTFSPMVQIAENMGYKYWQNQYKNLKT